MDAITLDAASRALPPGQLDAILDDAREAGSALALQHADMRAEALSLAVKASAAEVAPHPKDALGEYEERTAAIIKRAEAFAAFMAPREGLFS